MSSLRAAILLTSTLLCASGCGVEEYHNRVVQNSIPFLSYQQELNSNLTGRWRKGEVSLRLPAGLTEVPGPKKKDEKTRDKRLPPGLQIDRLTGLLGGFRGEVQAAGTSTKVPVYALILSNRELLSSRSPTEKPDLFHKTLLNRIGGAAGGQATRSDYKPFTVGGRDFRPTLRYEAATVDPSGGNVRYEIYAYTEPPSKLQVALVFLIPKEPDRAERLKDKIELSLQSLRVEAAGASGGATATAPSAGGSAPGF